MFPLGLVDRFPANIDRAVFDGVAELFHGGINRCFVDSSGDFTCAAGDSGRLRRYAGDSGWLRRYAGGIHWPLASPDEDRCRPGLEASECGVERSHKLVVFEHLLQLAPNVASRW